MSAEVKNRTSKFFEQFTATKDRPKEFQMTVMVLVTSAAICAVGALIKLAITHQ
jgi:hypothetical protein